MAILTEVGNGIGHVIGWIGDVIDALVTPASGNTPAGALYGLLPLFAIGISISAIMLGVRMIKSLVWGQ